MVAVILEIVLWSLAFAAVVILFVHQCRVQIREHRFYRARDWDMRKDSGMDKVDLPRAALTYSVPPALRFLVFRPLALVSLLLFMGAMLLNWT